jgi:hypothetical protein
MMVWKALGQPAIALRSRIVATTFIYALSVTVRFTTATGNEARIAAHAVHRSHPMVFLMTGDGLPIFCGDRRPKFALPAAFPSRGGFRAACARPMPGPERPDA